MIRPWQFITRIGRPLRSAMPLARSGTEERFLLRVAGVALFLALLICLLVEVQVVPEWQVRRAGVRTTVVNPEGRTTPSDVAGLQNEMRKTFIQIVAGAFAIVALYFTYRRVRVAEQGHITDRYTRAIEQLGALTADNKPNVEVRLGAIYALERIAIDSPRDHWTIMEVLTAYVRQNAPAPVQGPTEWENIAAIAKGPTTEVQAILTVLGRRRRGRWREQEGQRLDLRDSDLRGAGFYWAHLEGALFYRAHLEGASFRITNVEGARFSMAHIEEARFVGAYVEGARFYSAHVEGADFFASHVEGARFEGASVEGATFCRASLEGASFDRARVEGASFLGAVGLTVEQFGHAEGWEKAEFDEEFLRELRSARGGGDGPEDAAHQPETPPGGSRSGEDGAGGPTEVPDHPERRP